MIARRRRGRGGVGEPTNPTTGNRFDRLGPGDVTMLLTDRGQVPMNTGAVLVFDAAYGPGAAALRAVLADRVAAIPRLRQRVQRLPMGCGAPIWADDTDFAIDRHVIDREMVGCPSRRELLDVAAELVCERLPLEHPPWRAWLVVDSPAGQVRALVLVVHHVMADGLGGLAVLRALADPGLDPRRREFPQRRPAYRALAVDAARQRARQVTTLRAQFRLGLDGVKELNAAGAKPHTAGRTSLTRPTSGRRRLSTVDVPLTDLVTAAHAAGGTVNDVVLAAVTGALLGVLRSRGEDPRRLVVSVPVSGRAEADAGHLGNQTGVRPVEIPLIADDRTRLGTIVAITRASKGASRASSAVPLGFAFRFLARLRVFSWFVDHQHLVDTFETNLRGPVKPLYIAGHRVRSIIPMAVNPGNVSVSFDVLSYAGTLGITVVADPDGVPDLDLLAGLLADTLTRMCPPLRPSAGDTCGAAVRGETSRRAPLPGI